jgi:ketosteroid isomerase-like protein
MSVPEDEQAIRDLAAQYADAINRGDGVAAAAVYTRDGILEMSDGLQFVGQEKLRRVLCNLVEERREYLFLMTHSGLVQVSGERATARFWFSELKKPTGEAYEFSFGVYQDEAQRLDVGWRFTWRRPSILMRWRPTDEDVLLFPKPSFLGLHEAPA